jgi:hypothetical protein
MRHIYLIILLLLFTACGGDKSHEVLSQTPEAQETSELPQTPETPETPEVPAPNDPLPDKSNNEGIAYAPTGLPLVVIDTENGQPITSKETYLKATFSLTDSASPQNDLSQILGEVRGRGNTTWSAYDKKPYRFKFEEKQSVLGLTKAKSWVLLAQADDPSLLMTQAGMSIAKTLDVKYINHVFPVDLILNGDYRGAYLLTEHVQVGKGRIDIHETKGWFVEYDFHEAEDGEVWFETSGYHFPARIKSPRDLEDMSGYDFVKADIAALETLMMASDFPNNGYRDLIDLDSVASLFLANDIVRNNDFPYPGNFYLFKDKNKKIMLGPLWDVDHGFGRDDSWFGEFFASEHVPNLCDSYNPFIKRFFDDPVFRQKYKDLWNAKKAEVLYNVLMLINEESEKKRASATANFGIWDWQNREAYDSAVISLKTWLTYRMQTLDGVINGL